MHDKDLMEMFSILCTNGFLFCCPDTDTHAQIRTHVSISREINLNSYEVFKKQKHLQVVN